MNRFMDFLNRTLVYYLLRVILVVLSIVLCYVIASSFCYGKPSSLNTWWFICLLVIQVILTIYVMSHKNYTLFRIDKSSQCLKELEAITGKDTDDTREGWIKIARMIRLLPEEDIDTCAVDILDKTFHNAFVELEKSYTEKMSNLYREVDELTSKSKELLAAYQELEKDNEQLKRALDGHVSEKTQSRE